MKSFVQWLADAALVAKALPEPLPPMPQDAQNVLYVIPERYRSDRLAVRQVLQREGIEPINIVSLPPRDKRGKRFNTRIAHCLQSNTPLQIIPVSVFWGRRPVREDSFWRVMFSDNWAVPGTIVRFFTLLTQRRQIQCYFSPPLSLMELKQGSDPGDDVVKKLRRVLRTHFRRQREAVIGPDMSHRRTLQFQVLNSPQVIEALAAEPGNGPRKAKKYLNEIASDYSYSVVRMFDHLLSWLWGKLYRGVQLEGMQALRELATDHQLIYVPCHRSHIDYLLLSYVIYHQGLMPPHIAAGVNLNMPVVGSLLRRGGAFYIRREFRDNLLYRAVLESYLATMCQKGFPIEYFIEGGRSRTGRLLQPRAGMLVMTLNSIRRNQGRPLAFVPVYIGYERIIESHSYIKEMSGKSKKTESVGSLFSARRYLKEDFGEVHVQFGTAILQRDIWQHTAQPGAHMPPPDSVAFVEGVSWLSRAIMTGINGHAVITPINLLATLLLATPKHAVLESQLPGYLQALRRISQLPGSPGVVYHGPDDWGEAIAAVEPLGLFQRNDHAMGAVLLLNQRGALAATYLRNNTLHCFIVTSVIASVLVNRRKISEKRMQTLCRLLYPFLKNELFLSWSEDEIPLLVSHVLRQFLELGLIDDSDGAYQVVDSASEHHHLLSIISSISKGTMERYYIVLQLLTRHDNGHYTAASLEQDCVLMAQRLSLLYSFHAPDFFDKNLFRVFIEGLIDSDYLQQDEDGKLDYNKQVTIAERGFVYLLAPEVRLGILQITRH